MHLWDTLVPAAYGLLLAALATFGLHRYWQLYLFHRTQRLVPRPPPGTEGDPPLVTVQLPLFNERYVVDRLLDAVAGLDYPRDRLEVQVLDDSTDGTRARVGARVETLRAAGLAIRHLHREARAGFKAGALEAGLRTARGELIAVFDADFVPGPDFLRRVVPWFLDPGVGMVQTRWSHLNRDFSLLTRVQAMLLDGHFVIEHTARSRTGRFFNFNGTAGIWRRAAIEGAGGWQADTLTEDLDLSYRAQLAGWRFIYLTDATTPAELPVEMSAFKTQQHRWAKGATQTCLKLLPRIWRSRAPLKAKLEATVHLTSNVTYAMMLLLSLLMLPMLVHLAREGWEPVRLFYPVVFLVCTLSVALFYLSAERVATGCARCHARYLPWLMVVGIGMSWNNARAVVEAIVRRRSPFVRTPKYNVLAGDRGWKRLHYRGRHDLSSWLEVALGFYFLGAMVYAARAGLYPAIPFLFLFFSGFLYVGGLSLWQRRFS